MFLDSSIVIEIFRNPTTSKRFKTISKKISNEEIFISIIQLAEIADWAIRNNISAKDRVAATKEFARIVPLNEQICLDASIIKSRRMESGYYDFGLLDAIILATARSMGQRLLTFDMDFKGESDCLVL